MTRKENMLNYLHHRPCDEIPADGDIMLMGNTDLIETLDIPVCERPLTGSGYDVFGVHWSEGTDASHYTQGQPPIYDDIEDWRSQVRFPNVEKFDWAQLKADAQKVDRENKVVNVVMYNGPFERTTMLTSFEDCLVNLMISPEDYADLIGAIADYKIALIHKIWEAAQPDVYLIHDDWGTMKNTFMRPDMWREIIKPHTQRIYDAIHSHGAVVAQHSCGAITPLVPDMVEMGADVWDGEADCNDLPALKKQYEGQMVIPLKLPHAEMVAAMGDMSDVPPLPGAKYGGYAEYPEFLFT